MHSNVLGPITLYRESGIAYREPECWLIYAWPLYQVLHSCIMSLQTECPTKPYC